MLNLEAEEKSQPSFKEVIEKLTDQTYISFSVSDYCLIEIAIII